MIDSLHDNFLNLYLFKEIFFYGYSVKILSFLYFTSIFSSIFVIISKNPVISVLFLICLFLSISGYLITLGLNFIGLTYILVYVGAVSILFLFILMLINIRISELLNDTSNSIPLALLINIFFYFTLYLIPFFDTVIATNIFNDFTNKGEIMYSLSKTWDGSLAENPDITSIGNIMYTNYFIWLLLTSLILLLAMVGCICLVIS